MTGQGSPSTSLTVHRPTGSTLLSCWALVVALVGLANMTTTARVSAADRPAADAPVADTPATAATMRVRIAWGGGAERLWHGTIAVSKGTLGEPRPLGIEADEPGSIWLEDGHLVVRQRSSRSYDGVDVLVTAPLDARLLVNLTAADDVQRPAQIEVPLGEISGEFRNLQLDARDNHLLVRRTPGDLLRVSMAHQSLVFSPGEKFKLDVQPYLLPVPADTKLRLKAQLFFASDSRELWSMQSSEMRAGQSNAMGLEIPLPRHEGVYNLVLTAMHASAWPHSVRPSLNWKRTIAERRVQLLVLDPQPPAAGRQQGELSQLVEIDPANPRWWELKVKLPQLSQLSHLPHLNTGPLGNGRLQTVHSPLGDLAQLKPNNHSPDISWEAYTLTVNSPGRLHVLEVEYPSDVPQTLGLSILEPNAAGALVPIGLDSGVDVDDHVLDNSAPHWAKHRLVFWPRTNAPHPAGDQPPRPASGRLQEDSLAGRMGATAQGAVRRFACRSSDCWPHISTGRCFPKTFPPPSC